ncbi:DUF6090 family protein [Flagellimonas sp. 2504JD1-5]
MLKFFRKIRQKLLSENKLSKYLIYAIGEIILVVIGILIALQINNWNESKKLRNVEKAYLNEVRNNLIQDTLLLNKVISARKLRISRFIALDSSLNYSFSKIIGVLPEPDKVDHISYFFRNQRDFRSKIGTYKSLISEGKSSLISNRKLFNLIQNVYDVQMKSLEDIGKEIDRGYGEYRRKYAYTLKYGKYNSNNVKVNDSLILADLSIQFNNINFYTRQAVLLKEDIISLIELLEVESIQLNK